MKLSCDILNLPWLWIRKNQWGKNDGPAKAVEVFLLGFPKTGKNIDIYFGVGKYEARVSINPFLEHTFLTIGRRYFDYLPYLIRFRISKDTLV